MATRYKKYLSSNSTIPRSTLQRWLKKHSRTEPYRFTHGPTRPTGSPSHNRSSDGDQPLHGRGADQSLPIPMDAGLQATDEERLSDDKSSDESLNNSSTSEEEEEEGEEEDEEDIHFMNPHDTKYDTKLHPDCDFTLGETIFKFLSIYSKHCFTKMCLHDLLTFLSDILPSGNKFPKTKFQLLQVLKQLSPGITAVKHKYCESCQQYLGEFSEDIQACYMCQSTKVNGLFIEYPLKDLISNAFEEMHLYKYIDKFQRERSTGTTSQNDVSDILDGQEYYKLITFNAEPPPLTCARASPRAEC